MSELYNHDHENEVTIFAETNFRSQRRRFGIKTDDRRRHMYIIGKTGMGKTQLQENMVMSDIMAGHGVCYVDPHGDTAERILDLIPSNRVNDVVYFNPADMEFPVGFNILETANDNQKHLIASGLMGVFKKIWPDVWSPRMEYILLNCVLALIDYPGATLLGINRLLVDKDYRERVIAKIRDPIVKTFWVAEFTSWEVKYQTEAIAPIQNKVGQFLSASIIRNIVSQVKSTIDVRSIMDDSKIFIVNLSKGRIGEENMKLLGGMLISRLQMAAMERVGIPEAQRKDFYMFVDEFQNFATESFASILSEARKYRLNLIVAHQYIEQLTDEVKAAVIGNVGTIIAFRIGATDAEFLENEFSPTFTAEDLVNLTKFTVYLKLMVDGVSTSPFSASTLPPLAQFTGNSDKIIAVSRERYAMPRAQIAEKVLRWSGMESASLRIADEAAADALAQSSELDKTENDLNINISDAIAEDRSSQTDEAKSPASENKYMSAGSRQGGDEQRKANSEDLDEFGNPENEEEYLKISPERLKALVKPTQGKKKDKPMFSHTCSRCGKVWEMPIQLDASRPMFCADCLPIIKEEQKNKGKIVRSAPAPESRAMPARESTSGGRGAVAGGHQSFSGK
ncbi:MAG: type IV secretion system DNA-binding domain-containing protein, partial [Patescibacteria group bacterium]